MNYPSLYPSLYTSLQTMTTNAYRGKQNPDCQTGLFFVQPMNCNCTPIPSTNINNLYKDLCKDFLEKYAASNTLNIACCSHYYNSDTLISLHVHQNGINYLYELVGHAKFANTLAEIGISTMKYHSIVNTAQPLGKKSILATFYGYAEIAGKNFEIQSTIIFKIMGGSPRIINQILNIFL